MKTVAIAVWSVLLMKTVVARLVCRIRKSR